MLRVHGKNYPCCYIEPENWLKLCGSCKHRLYLVRKWYFMLFVCAMFCIQTPLIRTFGIIPVYSGRPLLYFCTCKSILTLSCSLQMLAFKHLSLYLTISIVLWLLISQVIRKKNHQQENISALEDTALN